MGLFGFVGKAIGKAAKFVGKTGGKLALFGAKTALSVASRGLSDKVLSVAKSLGTKSHQAVTTKSLKLAANFLPVGKTTLRNAAATMEAATAGGGTYGTYKQPTQKTGTSSKAKGGGRPPTPGIRLPGIRTALSAPKGRKPCKYGPRVGGRCPPKPKSSRSPSTSGGASSSRRTSSTTSRVAEKLATAVGRGVVAATVGGTRAQKARRTRAVTRGAVALAKKVGARGLGALGAGATAFAITRKTKAGGALGDRLVAEHFALRDRRENLQVKRFRDQVAAERKRGPVSSDRVRQIAKQYGLGG